MKHLGKTLKQHIELNGVKKRTVADAAGISNNYLSTIFNKETFDCEMWEKLCKAARMNPAVVFESCTAEDCSDDRGRADEVKYLKQLVAEKERLIKILMTQAGLSVD